jgi:hypothetical protein
MNERAKEDTAAEIEKLSSEDLAALIVDALLRADIVKASDVKHAIAIATEEVDVRKAMGDY